LYQPIGYCSLLALAQANSVFASHGSVVVDVAKTLTIKKPIISLTNKNYHQPSSTSNNYHNHHQPTKIITNHYHPSPSSPNAIITHRHQHPLPSPFSNGAIPMCNYEI
jgi:hypothetical protein